MQCNSCGTTLPPGARNCPACGTAVFASSPTEKTFLSSPGSPQPEDTPSAPSYPPGTFQESIGLPPGAQPGQPANSFQAGSYPSGQSAVPLQNPYEQPGYPPAQQPPLYLDAQQPQQPFYTPTPQPPLRPQQTRRGLSRSMTILLIVLALLIMLSGFGLIYYSTVYRPNQLHMQATATVQTLQTREAHATATANTQATGTAVAIANATGTAQAVATANVIATATALQNIYTTATNGSPVLNDTLGFNTGNNWDEDQAQGGGGCAFTGGTYHASIDTKGFYFACIAQNSNFANFAYQVQMTILNGDAGGLLFRANSSAFHFYLLSITHDGSFDLFVSKDQNHSTDLNFGSSSAIKKGIGQTNLVTVVVRGSSIYFYINKQYAGSVSDNSYKSGQIGVFADAHTAATAVAFKNAQVWKL
ncbi:MAG TPA: hypothetical protein VKP04_03425 [Ktedonobacteraceae bacterium]|nr:hypothetical protein [Ktedonobacteraceae bacterium]